MLTMVPTKFSSGVPSRYRVEGLPEGQTAEISCFAKVSVQVWKVRRNGAKFGGAYASEEEVLADLQAEYSGQRRKRELPPSTTAPRHCRFCGELFVPARHNAKTCSSRECRAKALRLGNNLASARRKAERATQAAVEPQDKKLAAPDVDLERNGDQE